MCLTLCWHSWCPLSQSCLELPLLLHGPSTHASVIVDQAPNFSQVHSNLSFLPLPRVIIFKKDPLHSFFKKIHQAVQPAALDAGSLVLAGTRSGWSVGHGTQGPQSRKPRNQGQSMACDYSRRKTGLKQKRSPFLFPKLMWHSFVL